VYACVECQDVITNPLCPTCLRKSIVSWLAEAAPAKVRAFYAAQKGIAPKTGYVTCIKCRGKMDLCTHCYSSHVLSWLRKDPELAKATEEFLTYFNFDLDGFEERGVRMT
jgi:hypothetical protein